MLIFLVEQRKWMEEIFIYIYIYICIYIEAFLSLFSIPWITKWLRLFHFLFACISLFWTTYFLFTLCVNCIFLCTSGWQSTWILRVVGFRRLCGQKLLLFLESTLLSKRASGMEAAFFLPTVIRRQVFDGVCFSKAVGRCQNALKFLNRWKQCFSQDRTWDAIHVIRDSNTSDVTIPFF